MNILKAIARRIKEIALAILVWVALAYVIVYTLVQLSRRRD